MPSIPSVRKNLLQVLDAVILPLVQASSSLPVILAAPPWNLPPAVSVTHLSQPPLQEDKKLTLGFGVESLFAQHWPEAQVNSFHYRYLALVVEGEADLRVGVTETLAKASAIHPSWTESGCHVLHLPAPSFILFPPGVPYSDGTGTHWERSGPAPARIRILWIHLLPDGPICHLCQTERGKHSTEHALQVSGESLATTMDVLETELRNESPDSEFITQQQLLVFLLCLRRNLAYREVSLGNTAWLPEPKISSSEVQTSVSENARQVVKQADEYIQRHLSQPITLPEIAAHCGVSPTYLNRLFCAAMGVSVKRYVSKQRISVASWLLERNDLAIKEIAQLVGFSNVTYFCHAFKLIQNTSPAQYRIAIREKTKQSS